MKKKIIIILIIVGALIGGIFLYNYLRVKFAKIEVELASDLTLEFNEERKVSSYIESINGKIIDDYVIKASKLGQKEVNFEFINDDNIKVKYSYDIEVVDTTKPLIWLSGSYSLPVNSDVKLTDKIMCGDNYDAKPNCFIEGEYDLKTVGIYPLIFKAIDNSGNEETVSFNLNVYEPKPSSNNNTTASEESFIAFSDVVQKYKTKKNKIGIDVSSFQGDIDFKKLKSAGVEFVIVRVGSSRGTNGDYFVDKKFKRNMKEAKKHGIDTGVYFYSYANSKALALKDAEFVLKQIKDYDVKLPIVYDWEEWGEFNDYNLSFFGLTSMAETFLDAVSKKGYKGMLYSSKNYLEKVWLKTDYDIWLAHYTEKTNYEGKYKMWQLCSDGKVDGIDGYVDIDIMYD